jgi:Phosphotransferase system cellobiose-specific component IIC
MENKGKNNNNGKIMISQLIAVFIGELSIFSDIYFVPILIIFVSSVAAFIIVLIQSEGKSRIKGLFGALIIFIVGMCLLHFSNNRNATSDVPKKIPEGVDLGKFEITFDDFLFSYNDEQETGTITDSIKGELLVETIAFESHDYDVKIEDYTFENNVLTFEGVPSGNCAINIKFSNYNLISENLTLNKKDMQDNVWKKKITLQEETDYKNFSVAVFDCLNKPLSEDTCDIEIEDVSENIQNILVGEDGTLPYNFCCKANSNLTLVLHHGENNFTETLEVSQISGTTNVIFSDVYSLESLKEQEEQRIKEEEQKQKEEAKRKAAEIEQIEAENNPQILLKNLEPIQTNIKQNGKTINQLTDRLLDEERQKTYAVSIEQAGPYWIDFNHVNLTEESTAWKICIMDNDGNTYMDFTSAMNRVNTSSPIVGLPVGTYNIYVESYGSFSDAEYQVNLMTAEIPNYECEPNHEILTAQPFPEMSSNQAITYFGNLTYDDDVDYYSIQLLNSGVLAFKFEHENLTEDTTGWYITVKDVNSETLVELDSNWKNISTLSPNIGLEMGTYYIEIRAYGSYNDSVYALSTAFYESDSWETEFNDQIGQADILLENVYKHGNLSLNNDVDYYVFQCNKNANYQLTFEHENLTEDMAGWAIDILDKNSDSILEEELYSNCNETKNTVTAQMKEGETYYISVRCINYTMADYKLKLEN